MCSKQLRQNVVVVAFVHALGIMPVACVPDEPSSDEPAESGSTVPVDVLSFPYLETNVGSTTSLLVQDDELFVFDSDQQSLHRMDGSGGDAVMTDGQGPGEIGGGSGTVASYRADSLLVFDPGNRRLSVLDSAARLGRTIQLPDDWVWHVEDMFLGLGDGRLVQIVQGSSEWNGVVTRDPEGAVVDTILRLDYSRPAVVEDGEPLVHILPDRVVSARRGDQMFLGTTASRRIHRLDLQDGVYESFEVLLPAATPPGAALRRRLETIWEERSSLSDMPPNLVDRIRLVIPDSLPLVSAVIPLPGDFLLLQGPPDEELDVEEITMGGRYPVGGTGWIAADGDGNVLGRVSFTHRFRPFQLDHEAAYGLIPGGTLGVQVGRVQLADLTTAVRTLDP